MAKARKLTISRSERFLGSYGHAAGNHHAPEDDDDGVELGEVDVWCTADDVASIGSDDQHSVGSAWSSRASVEGGTRSNRHRRRSGGLLPGSGGGLAVAFDDQPGEMVRIVHQFRNGNNGFASTRGREFATSAPVHVPDWSKVYRVDSVESMHDSDEGTDDQDSDMIPPHEYLARSHRSAAKSVFEGVGRTLKGRDLSRVRDAVWSQTGFDG